MVKESQRESFVFTFKSGKIRETCSGQGKWRFRSVDQRKYFNFNRY